MWQVWNKNKSELHWSELLKSELDLKKIIIIIFLDFFFRF